MLYRSASLGGLTSDLISLSEELTVLPLLEPHHLAGTLLRVLELWTRHALGCFSIECPVALPSLGSTGIAQQRAPYIHHYFSPK